MSSTRYESVPSEIELDTQGYLSYTVLQPKKVSTCILFALIVSTFTSGALVAFLLLQANPSTLFFYDTPQKNYVPKYLLEEPRLPTIFQEEPKLKGTSAEADRAWDDVMPIGRGFVDIKNPESYSLAPGIYISEDTKRYSMSAFHQLHCLGMLRDAFHRAIAAMNDASFHHPLETNSTSDHLEHCFDYLRQGIMCAGDLTLESARVEKDGSRIQVDGWGIAHQCRDWNAIKTFAIEHRASNRSGILMGHVEKFGLA